MTATKDTKNLWYIAVCDGYNLATNRSYRMSLKIRMSRESGRPKDRRYEKEAKVVGLFIR